MTCTTHHFACECREKEFANALEREAILKEALKNIYADGSYKDIASEFAAEALAKAEGVGK